MLGSKYCCGLRVQLLLGHISKWQKSIAPCIMLAVVLLQLPICYPSYYYSLIKGTIVWFYNLQPTKDYVREVANHCYHVIIGTKYVLNSSHWKRMIRSANKFRNLFYFESEMNVHICNEWDACVFKWKLTGFFLGT